MKVDIDLLSERDFKNAERVVVHVRLENRHGLATRIDQVLKDKSHDREKIEVRIQELNTEMASLYRKLEDLDR